MPIEPTAARTKAGDLEQIGGEEERHPKSRAQGDSKKTGEKSERCQRMGR